MLNIQVNKKKIFFIVDVAPQGELQFKKTWVF